MPTTIGCSADNRIELTALRGLVVTLDPDVAAVFPGAREASRLDGQVVGVPDRPGRRLRRTSTSRSRRRSRPRFVVCVDSSAYPASLELHKIYQVLADDDAVAAGDLRVVDESGEDYLYPAEWFAALELPRRVRASLMRPPAGIRPA